MNTTIGEFEKQKLSCLFQHYHEQKQWKWKQIEQAGIPIKTFANILNGKIVKKDDYYANAIKVVMKMEYFRIDDFTEWLNSFIELFDSILICNNENKFQLLFQKLDTELKPYSNFIIYHEYYFAFLSILKFYENHTYFSLEQMESYLSLIKCGFFETKIAIYLLESIFVSNKNLHGNPEIRKQIVNYSNLYGQEMLLSHIHVTDELQNGNMLNALEISNISKKYWKNKGNAYRELKCQLDIFSVYKNTDFEKAVESISELIRIKNSKKIPIKAIIVINYNVAMFYYLNKEYQKAFDLFMENITEYNCVKEWSFIGSICTRIGREIPKEIQEAEINELPHKEYIVYYQMKQSKKYSNEVLMYYILDEIVLNHLKKTKFYYPRWEMFENEMFELSKDSTKCLKLYHLFIKKRQNFVENT